MVPIRYRTAGADGFKVFYREAGDAAAPKLLLLHGFPSACSRPPTDGSPELRHRIQPARTGVTRSVVRPSTTAIA
jgi:pimeloyl-ACP methyl ester carboxylesterase